MKNLYIVSGPSGAGKTTLVSMLLSCKDNKAIRPVTHTSRAPRDGEVDGIHYHFKTRKEFEKMIAENAFVEYAEVHGNLYGTSKESLGAARADQVVVLILDCEGAASARRIYPMCTTIFITVPPEELRKRLTARGQNSQEDIELRLKTASIELERAKMDGFDHVIENVNLLDAATKLFKIASKECRLN